MVLLLLDVLPECTAEDQSLAEAADSSAAAEEFPPLLLPPDNEDKELVDDLEPRLERSEMVVSVEVDCLSLRFCNNLLLLLLTMAAESGPQLLATVGGVNGINRKPSRVALWKAS